MKVKLVDGMPIAYHDDGGAQMLDPRSEGFRKSFGHVIRRHDDGGVQSVPAGEEIGPCDEIVLY